MGVPPMMSGTQINVELKNLKTIIK